MPRTDVFQLVRCLCDAQCEANERVLKSARFENLDDVVPDGFTVRDVLQMWSWHFWSHHRELVRARGSLRGDNPHFHVPHFIREANEELGRFIGELACLTDDQLDLQLPEGDRSVRDIVEHVLGVATGYIPDQIEHATHVEKEEQGR